MKGYKNVGLTKAPNLHYENKRKRNSQFGDDKNHADQSKQAMINRIKNLQKVKKEILDEPQ